MRRLSLSLFLVVIIFLSALILTPLVTAPPAFAATITNPAGVTLADLWGSDSPDLIINGGTISNNIYGNNNIESNSFGGNNQIFNTGTVEGDIFGSYNLFARSSGGSNFLNNSGDTDYLCGSVNEGADSFGGTNMVINSGRVFDILAGSVNDGANTFGGANTVVNSGEVFGGMTGSLNSGQNSSGSNNTATNSGDVNDFVGSVNTGQGSSGGSNTVVNNDTAVFIEGSYNIGDQSTGGYNRITNTHMALGILGSRNEGLNSSGGYNTIINTGKAMAIYGSANDIAGFGVDGIWGGVNHITNQNETDVLIGSFNGGLNSVGGSNTLVNSGKVNFDIFGSYNNGENASGGSNTITNTATGVVSGKIFGSFNEGDNSSGGSNIITHEGVVTGDSLLVSDIAIVGSYNSGAGSTGGSNVINISNDGNYIFGTYNVGVNSSGGNNTINIHRGNITQVIGSRNYTAGTSGGGNTIINYGGVMAADTRGIFGTINRQEDSSGGNNTIENYSTVGFLYGSKNNEARSSGGENTLKNYGIVTFQIWGSSNEKDDSTGGGNVILNAGTMTGSVVGSNNSGLRASGSQNVITNSGTVTGNIYGSRNSGVDSSSLSGNTITNSGTVTGDIYGNRNTGAGSVGGNDVITNSGIVTGSIFGEDGNDTIIHGGGQRIDGVSDGGTGTDTLGFSNYGTINDLRTTKYLNFENIGIYGGTNELMGNWNVTGGTITVDTGELFINGNVSTDALIINAAGILCGSGTITSPVTAHGTIAPGNSVGTLNIVGDFDFASGSIYRAELEISGAADLINSTGAVTLNNATLNPQMEKALYSGGETWTILQAAGGVTGNFTTILQPGSGILHIRAINNGNSLGLVATRLSYQTLALSPSSREVAAGLDRIFPQSLTNNDRMTAFLTALDLNYTPQGGTRVLEMLTPYLYDNISDLTGQSARRYDQNLALRTGLMHRASLLKTPLIPEGYSDDQSALPRPEDQEDGKNGLNVWTRAFTSLGNRNMEDNIPGYNATTRGIVVGTDKRFLPDVLLGVSFGTSNADLRGDSDTGNGRSKGIHSGVYGLWESGQFYMDTSLTYAHYGNDAQRPVISGDGSWQIIKSDYSSNAFGGRLSAGYDFPADNWFLTPAASFSALNVREDGFRESDNGQPVIQGDSRSNAAYESTLGIRLTRLFKLEGTSVVPRFEASWTHGFNRDRRVLDATIGGYESVPMEIEGRKNGDMLLLAAGLQTLVSQNLSFYLDYNLSKNADYTGHMFSLGLDWKF